MEEEEFPYYFFVSISIMFLMFFYDSWFANGNRQEPKTKETIKTVDPKDLHSICTDAKFNLNNFCHLGSESELFRRVQERLDNAILKYKEMDVNIVDVDRVTVERIAKILNKQGFSTYTAGTDGNAYQVLFFKFERPK